MGVPCLASASGSGASGGARVTVLCAIRLIIAKPRGRPRAGRGASARTVLLDKALGLRFA